VLFPQWIFAEVLFYLIATFHIGVHCVKIKSIISRSLDRIFIGKVNVKNGVADVVAMETMSAMPIEGKVAMSLVVVPRQGITAIQTGDKIVRINQKQ
jgi:hypothetical protein